MRRELMECKFQKDVNGCCPGHDTYPDEKYSSRRSVHARSRDKKIEHQHARALKKHALLAEVRNHWIGGNVAE